MAIERVRGSSTRAEVIDYLREREPHATAALVAISRQPSARHAKIWAARKSGKIVGLLVCSRWCFDHWISRLFIDDPSVAREMAAVLDRSNARTVTGPVDGVEAVLAAAKRAKSQIRLWFYSIPPQPPENGDAFARNTDVKIRDAARADLEALVDLYTFDEHTGGITRRRLRHVVRERIAHIRVAEIDGRIVGAIVAPSTAKYRVLDMLIVHPQARGRRLGIALLIDVGTEAVIAGKGICGLRAMTNGLRVSHEETLAIGEAETWAAADLRPPVRFRGQGRLRKLLARLDGGVIVPPRPEVSPYSVLPDQEGRAREPAPAQGESPAE